MDRRDDAEWAHRYQKYYDMVGKAHGAQRNRALRSMSHPQLVAALAARDSDGYVRDIIVTEVLNRGKRFAAIVGALTGAIGIDLIVRIVVLFAFWGSDAPVEQHNVLLRHVATAAIGFVGGIVIYVRMRNRLVRL